MKHPTQINYDGDLVEDIGNLRYDALRDFLWKLKEKIERDGDADKARGREQLSGALYAASEFLDHAGECIQWAWEISEPHMK